MSAICGMMGRRSATHPNPDLGTMLDALADYGLGRTEWSDGAVHIGRRCRLDDGDGAPPKRRASAEPAVSLHRCREAGLALAADVRLDDREALQDALGCRGAEVSDGELILRAYRRWGRDCPSRLLGDYAFALWDGCRRILFCARDHIGVKPFYYARTGESFVFASAVPAVLAAPGVSGRLDDDFVAAHLTRIGPNTTVRTFFAAVRKLPPGHALTVTGDGRLLSGVDPHQCAAKADRLLGRPLHLEGGDVALRLAELHPDQVNGLVEVAVLVRVSFFLDLRQRLALRRVP